MSHDADSLSRETEKPRSGKILRMTYVADLHLHSSYAMATSKELNFENLAKWAGIKGIDLLSSADFTHPLWFDETKSKLRETDDGLLALRKAPDSSVRFVLGTEVNCNGQQGGRNRRVHMLVFAPDLRVAERINDSCSKHGILTGDGRPTLHLTPRELLELLLEIDERNFVIPAHVWTPWFGIYGSKSGFDSLEECFGDLADRVFAIETGLSSDPAMNWGVSELDNRAIVSFSDAHSLPKMGRELTVIEGELSYDGLLKSLKNQGIAYTVEFFPEEGKYHNSGHRNCGVSLSPADVEEVGDRCPACKRLMTHGVAYRMAALSSCEVKTWTDEAGLTRSEAGRPPFKSLVGLQQIIAESLGRGVNTKGVLDRYLDIVGEFGSELATLMEAPLTDLTRTAGERIAEGIGRVRRGDVSIEPGYDGKFGRVSVWPDE